METNEVMTNEVINETVEVEESKKFNPATGMVVLLAAYGTYCLVLEGVTATKKLVKKIKYYKDLKTNNVSEELDNVVEFED